MRELWQGDVCLSWDESLGIKIEEEQNIMLVLARKVDDKICIGDDIVITVCEIRPRQVKIGIQCPPELKVQRQELMEQKY